MPRIINRILLAVPVGPFAIGESFVRAFIAPGREVLTVNLLDYFPISAPLPARVLRRLFRERLVADYNRSLLINARCFRPDLLLVAKGNQITPATLAALRDDLPATTLVNINYDDYFSSAPSNRFSDLAQILPYYDWIFPSKSANLSELRRLGARQLHYLPLGYDDSAHFPVRPTKEQGRRYRSQVVFAGTYTPARAQALERLHGYTLAIWGGHWPPAALSSTLRHALRQSGRNRVVRALELSAILNSSQIALNFLRAENNDTHNHRSFELPACGVFTLSERSAELEQFFAEDREMVFFSTPEELREKVAYYLPREEVRHQIAQAGYRRLLADGHTIADRLRQMLDLMDLA